VTRVVWLSFALLVSSCALLVSSCAQVQVKPPTGPLEFELAGRIAAQYGKEAFTGSIVWRHARTGDELLISTPMGQGVARIVREGDAVVLTTSEPREYRDNDVEALTERVLGFRLPLSGLADWVRGRPSDGAPFKAERSPDGRLKILEQRGWRIEYPEYDAALPTRLRLTYQGIDLRLAITQWN
jgi:outer membrane lipoprotein LolB